MYLRTLLPITVTLLATIVVDLSLPAFAHKVNKIVGKQSGLKVQRGRVWSTVKEKEELDSNDRVKLEKGTKALILCDDQKNPKSLEPGVSGVASYCDNGTAIRHSSVYRLGGSDPAIPYVINPRLTLLRTTTPTFRWNKVSEASNYVVRLMSTMVWKQPQITTKVELPYPSNEKSLDVGVQYWLVVEAGRSSSIDEWCPSPYGFEILQDTPDELKRQLDNKLNRK